MLGERIRFARETAGLRQSNVAEKLGISESGISEIESGKREPKAAHLSVLAGLFHRSIDFFFSDEPLRPDYVLWRCRPEDEEQARRLQREFLQLCEDYRTLEELLGCPKPLSLPEAHSTKGQYDYEDAENLALDVWMKFRLGDTPAEVLPRVLEEYNVRVFALEMGDKASASCTRSERLGACILLNMNSKTWRRNFDMAHELFHLLTWGIFRTFGDEVSNVASAMEESMANVFASRLLLPEVPFCQRLHRTTAGGNPLMVSDVHELAREFNVSAEAVVYRVAGLSRWPKERTAEAVERTRACYPGRESHPISCLPERYVVLTERAYRQGLISFAQAAKYLRMGFKKAQSILEPPEDVTNLDSPLETAHR
jgi:XRE family transcriptional regulator, fatty acid utilization regulator